VVLFHYDYWFPPWRRRRKILRTRYSCLPNLELKHVMWPLCLGLPHQWTENFFDEGIWSLT
jgi:hypothetical protein